MSRFLRQLVLSTALISTSPAWCQQPALVISGFMANPAGSDNNKEFVELLATREIDFATEPYTVVFNDGANASTTNGWATGGTGSYAFSISTDAITRGQKLYVGGNSYTTYVNGASCNASTRNTGAASAAFSGGVTGNGVTGGVLGNGGGNADGLAVFSGASTSVSNTSVPIDAIFFGTGAGSASGKFLLPTNDRYNNAQGRFGVGTNTFVAPDPGDDIFVRATGSFDTVSNSWIGQRNWTGISVTAAAQLNCAAASGITLTVANTLSFTPSSTQNSSLVQAPNISGVIGDVTDPLATTGLVLEVKDNGVDIPAASYTITASSSNTAVVSNGNMAVTKADGLATVRVTPSGVGYSTITLTLTRNGVSQNYVLNYAASSSGVNGANARFHTGYSDASAALRLDNDYMVIADDENNTLAVYNRNLSGLPAKTFSYGASLNLTDLDGGLPREVDVEGVAESIATPGRSYWIGSMSNKSSSAPFSARPNRDRIFATNVTGTGAATAFSVVGYAQLRSQLISWGDAQGYGLSASAADGQDPKLNTGFNIEGMAFAPDNTTLYIGFRAPLLPVGSRVNALIAPVQNFESWFGNGSPATNPTFGSPILLNLAGRGIRDIVRNPAGGYTIVAGDYDDAGALTSKVYSWNGTAIDAPIEITGYNVSALNPEAVLPVYNGATLQANQLQFISDNGASVQYGDGIASKDLTVAPFKKFRSDVLTLGVPLPVRFNSFYATRRDQSSAQLQWSVGSVDAASYDVQRSIDGADFTSIARVPAEAGSNIYTANDDDAAQASVVYYRIKAQTESGAAYYTNLQSVRFDESVVRAELFPNPVSSDFMQVRCSGFSGVSTYVITRPDGATLAKGSLTLGVNQLSAAGLASGLYFLKVFSGNSETVLRFAKQ